MDVQHYPTQYLSAIETAMSLRTLSERIARGDWHAYPANADVAIQPRECTWICDRVVRAHAKHAALGQAESIAATLMDSGSRFACWAGRVASMASFDAKLKPMPFHDLIAHKGFADAALLSAIAQHPAASTDVSLRTLLHHMLVSNRFWLLSIVGEPFHVELETRVPDSLDAVIDGFRATHTRETEWLAHVTGDAFSRTLESALIPGGRCVVSDAVLQVCLHSQGHRAQCAKMLRALGGVPPATDFILWRADRPAPSWPA